MTMEPASRFAREMANERSVSKFIPYTALVSPTTIVTANGDFLRIWKVEGISFETAEVEDVLRRKDELNMLLRSLGSLHTAIWTHQVRRRVSDRLHATFSNEFSTRINERYYEALAGEDADGNASMMANELYVTLIYRPAPTRVDKLNRKGAKRSLGEIIEDREASIAKLDELARELEAGLRRYNATPLTSYKNADGVEFSQPLEFLNFLLTGEWQKVRVPYGPLNEYLGNAYVFVGLETIHIRTPMRDRRAQLIDFKDYPERTEPGVLNKVMMTKTEYVITQSFSFLDKRAGLKFLEQTEKQMRSAEDGSSTQREQLIVAKDELTQGRFVLGEYHFSLMVFGDNQEKVDKAAADLLTIFKEDGFLAVKVATATDAAFYAQLPCNWDFRPRIATLTSLNFAGLAPLHNFPHGKRDGNPWGQAVSLFKTPSQQPFYFNFHASKDDEDAYDRKTLANTRVIGASGTGKTVLLNFLLSQATKFAHRSPTGFGSVFYDKDRGAELAIRAMGGRYLPLKSGVPTGFNPFQMEPTEPNLLFLERWVAGLVTQDGSKLTAMDEQRISHAVRSVMKMPQYLRRLAVVYQNLPEGSTAAERENSISRRLEKWIEEGPYAWVADNPTDALDLSTHSIYGFDGTSFLDDPVVSPAISAYLLHRMEEMIDGRRFIYTMDEAWKWVNDPTAAATGRRSAFAEFAGNKQLTIRKQNGFGVFATQMPSSLLESDIGSALVQQCATEIYLPNPKADRNEYVNGFKVTPTEFEMIAAMPEDCRMFMVKQGHRSALAKLDLGQLGEDLHILSGSTDNVELLDDILAEVGEDPAVWLPVFHRRRKERAGRGRVILT